MWEVMDTTEPGDGTVSAVVRTVRSTAVVVVEVEVTRGRFNAPFPSVVDVSTRRGLPPSIPPLPLTALLPLFLR